MLRRGTALKVEDLFVAVVVVVVLFLCVLLLLFGGWVGRSGLLWDGEGHKAS